MQALPDPMFLTLPNLLTLLRIFAVPVFAIMLWYGKNAEACALFVAAGLTDMLDGFIARRFNQKSDLGAILDPAADKLLMTTAFLLMSLLRERFLVPIPFWVAALAIARDLLISLVALMDSGHFDPAKFAPSILGKLTTVLEVTVIAAGLLFNAMGPRSWYAWLVPWMYYLVALMVLISGTHYFYRASLHRSELI